ncbi:hypothetical protein [Aeromonas sp. 3P]|uniref:hypothetical protein n=1 Tax=Aeromonas sp. 3P TaxID=3452719 RepID=UPI003F7ABFDE
MELFTQVVCDAPTYTLKLIPKLFFSDAMALRLIVSVEPFLANDSSPMIREFAG